MITGALAWEFAKDDKASSARATWYCGLVFALTAVTIATQQSLHLNRARCHPRRHTFIKNVIGLQAIQGVSSGGKRRKDLKLALYLWQTSIMLLNFSIILALVGVIILVVEMEKGEGVSHLTQPHYHGDH